MKTVVCIILGLFAMQISVNAAEINTSKVLIDHNKKLNQLKKVNKNLQGQIEVLQQQQKVNAEKIQSLFHLLKYKKTNVVNKKTLHVEEKDKVAKKAYADAKGFLMIGEHDKAIELFTTYLKDYPNNNHTSDAHYWLAKSYLAKEKYHIAKKVFIEFQRENGLHHKFSNSLYELATTYVELGKNPKAVLLLNTMIRKFPDHASIFKAKALLKELQKKTVTEIVKTPTAPQISTQDPVVVKAKTEKTKTTTIVNTSEENPIKTPVNIPAVKSIKTKSE